MDNAKYLVAVALTITISPSFAQDYTPSPADIASSLNGSVVNGTATVTITGPGGKGGGGFGGGSADGMGATPFAIGFGTNPPQAATPSL